MALNTQITNDTPVMLDVASTRGNPFENADINSEFIDSGSDSKGVELALTAYISTVPKSSLQFLELTTNT
jgi:hypothetical protein